MLYFNVIPKMIEAKNIQNMVGNDIIPIYSCICMFVFDLFVFHIYHQLLGFIQTFSTVKG